MFTVALIGPDGAGKTSIARRLPDVLPMPATYLYMGVNLECSTLMLPTTRLLLSIKRIRGRRPEMVAASDQERRRAEKGGARSRAAIELKSLARMGNWIAEEAFRQLIAWYYRRKGYVVVCDRDFYCDYYAYDIDQRGHRPLGNRIHGSFLTNLYRKPDLVIFMDGAPESLVARKPGVSLAYVKRRRDEYLQLRDRFSEFVAVDAVRPIDAVMNEIAATITHRYDEKRSRTQVS